MVPTQSKPPGQRQSYQHGRGRLRLLCREQDGQNARGVSGPDFPDAPGHCNAPVADVLTAITTARNAGGNVRVSVPYSTQDNTPPGPIFGAQAHHSEKKSASPDFNPVAAVELSRRELYENVLFGSGINSLRSNRAIEQVLDGVFISCEVYGLTRPKLNRNLRTPPKNAMLAGGLSSP